MIDLSSPRYSGAEAAKASGIPATTFRSYFARGHFRVLGDARERDANGLPHLFSLRDILGLAVALRLMATVCVSAARAFEIGMFEFAHAGSSGREPGAVYDVCEYGETLLLFWPETGKAEVRPYDRAMMELGLNSRSSVCILVLNRVIADVYSALKLNPRVGYEGTPAAPGAGWKDPDEGELVGE